MKYLVAVHGAQGLTVSLQELFSRISARWMWVNRQNPVKKGALPVEDEDFKVVAIGMCVLDGRSLAEFNAELVRMPGAGIISVEIHPLAA